jgi:glycosyltransferase involved in cell wall biosynthesis
MLVKRTGNAGNKAPLRSSVASAASHATVATPSSKLVSIVIPFYNESECIEPLYQALCGALDCIPRIHFEVICVDDGSRDDTVAIALAIRDLRQTIDDGRLRWSGPSPFRIRPMPRSADFRAARIKAVALMLARRIKDTDEGLFFGTGLEPEPFATLSEHGRSAMFQLVPRRRLTRESFASVGNRFLCRPNSAVDLRTRLLQGQLEAHEREAHVVSDEALRAGQDARWDDFIAIRSSDIVALEQSFVHQILARHPEVRAPEIV